MEAQLTLRLIPGPDDPPLSSEICQQDLKTFASAARATGFDVSALLLFQESVGSIGSEAELLGEFFIRLATNKDLWLVLGPIIVAWLTRRYGRKVRLKVGDIEAEAQTVKEVETLLDKAQEIQQRNQPKVIHEP